VKGRSAAEVAFMAAPFGILELPKKNEVSGDFLPKHYVLNESTEVAHSLSVSFDCDSSSEEWRGKFLEANLLVLWFVCKA
jgi:hypothetical protein